MENRLHFNFNCSSSPSFPTEMNSQVQSTEEAVSFISVSLEIKLTATRDCLRLRVILSFGHPRSGHEYLDMFSSITWIPRLLIKLMNDKTISHEKEEDIERGFGGGLLLTDRSVSSAALLTPPERRRKRSELEQFQWWLLFSVAHQLVFSYFRHQQSIMKIA